MHNIKSISTTYVAQLSALYGANEAKSISNLVLSHVLRYDKAQLILNANEMLSAEVEEKLLKYLETLETGKPVQYVLGTTEFCDLEFKVNEHVLIPRPETELLVRWIIEDCKDTEKSIIDIGTGSGIIPVSLKYAMPNASVNALDVSEEALFVAKENAKSNNVAVHFFQCNVLEDSFPGKYDIIVSNPPYVPEADMDALHKNVRDHEPHLALFVPNDNALVFYNRIADLAVKFLRKPGWLYFEMYSDYAAQIAEMLEQKGFEDVEIRKDLSGKDRMIRAKLR